MKHVSVLLIAVLLLVTSAPAFAGPQDICFAPQTSADMIVELETTQNLRDQVGLLKQGNAELQQQIALLKQIIDIHKSIIDLQKQQIAAGKEANDQLKDMIKFQQEQYSKLIKDLQPSFLDTLKNILTGVVIGAVVAAIFL